MNTRLICDDCGSILTDEERHYYAGRCEGCEREWHETLTRWRKGEDNPEIDKLFDAPKPVLQ